MKTSIVLFALVFGYTAFAQSLTLGDSSPMPLKLEKGKIYQNGEQIPSYQVKKILATNLHSLKVYKQAQTKQTLGGALLGLGSAAVIVDGAIGLFSDAKYPTALTYGGLGAIAISLPILSGRAKRVEDAVNSYNEGLKTVGATHFEMNAVVNQNGIGFQIQF